MTQLTKTGAIGDTDKFTLSFWFRLKSAPSNGSLFYQGSAIAPANNHNYGLIAWGYQNNDDDTGFSESWSIISIEDDVLQLCIGGAFSPPVLADGTGPEMVTAFSTSAYPAICVRVPLYSGFHSDTSRWHHLLVSVDVSSGDTITVGDNGGPSYGPVQDLHQNSLIGIRLDNILYRATFTQSIAGVPTFTPSSTDGAADIEVEYKIDYPSLFTSAGAHAYDLTTVSISGLQFAIPQIDGFNYINNAQHNASVTYAYMMGWFNQALNIADLSVIRKFITADRKPPDNGTSARNAFGMPHIWFYRDKKNKIDFKTNHGSAGAFTVIGSSPTDFSPGPSF